MEHFYEDHFSLKSITYYSFRKITSKIFENNHSGRILAEDQACHVIYQLKTSSNKFDDGQSFRKHDSESSSVIGWPASNWWRKSYAVQVMRQTWYHARILVKS